MKPFMIPLRVALFSLLVLALASPLAAQMTGRLDGEVKDGQGKPFPGVIVKLKHAERGQQMETTTDRYGRYTITGLLTGIWTLTFVAKDPASNELKPFHEAQIRIQASDDNRYDVDIKQLIEQMSEKDKEARRKAEEEKSKFESMKAHFEAGRAALDQIRATRAEMARVPRTEHGPYLEKISATAATAISEFEAAIKNVDPKESNYAVVMFNLGRAYDEAGRYEDAIQCYNRALEVTPNEAGYYQELGTTQARAGKVQDAVVTCTKVASLPAAAGTDPKVPASNCFGNVAIILQNAGRMKESVEPARKATELNPAQADYWFLLGRGLTNAMEFKKEGDKYITVVQPGTAESFQKYLELAPNGRFAAEAKASLESLAALDAGIATKVNVKKKK